MLVEAIAGGIALAAITIAGCLHVRNMYLEKLIRCSSNIANVVLLDDGDGVEIIEDDEAVLLIALSDPFGAVAERLVAAKDGTTFLEILDGRAPDVTPRELARAVANGADLQIGVTPDANFFGPGGGDLHSHDKGPR